MVYREGETCKENHAIAWLPGLHFNLGYVIT
jgi:hypothetical protein